MPNQISLKVILGIKVQIIALFINLNKVNKAKVIQMAFGITFENKTNELKTTLSDLKIKVPEIESAAIVSIEGLPIASVLPQEIEEARLAAMTAAMLSLGERVAQEMQRGELEKIFIEGAYGYIITTAAGQNAVLTVSARKEAKLGLVFLDMARAAQEVERQLS